jgi:hypothetical protein
MARSIATIQSLMINDVNTNIPSLTSTSKRAIWRLWTFVFATAIYLLESLIDVFKASVETTAASAAPASAAWLQNQIFLFQYDPTTPQIIQLVNFAPAYPVVDATKQIISRCSITTTQASQVVIKAATGTPPTALSAPQLSALQSYVNTIGATVNYIVTSSNPDQLYVDATIYYDGQFSEIIQETVITGITNLLANVPFNGQLKVSDIEKAILAVQGVNDCMLNNVIARQDATSFGNGTFLLQNQQQISLVWNTVAGYIIPETTTGETLASSLTFRAQ